MNYSILRRSRHPCISRGSSQLRFFFTVRIGNIKGKVFRGSRLPCLFGGSISPRCFTSSIVRIGNVERKVFQSADHRDKIPSGYLASFDGDKSVLGILQWLMKKDRLEQDSLLVGHASSSIYRRRLVLAYAELIQQPVEILTISRDTTESDLKQKRVLTGTSKGTIDFQDQAPVRAAKNGHLLVLDGLQNAERNVLPTLNGLLENREMQLEDGTFLCNHGESIPVHKDFRVIGLHSVPTRLDPPVRSRFQIKRVDEKPVVEHEQLYKLAHVLLERETEFPVSSLPYIETTLKNFPEQSLYELLNRAAPYNNLDTVCRELEISKQATRYQVMDAEKEGDGMRVSMLSEANNECSVVVSGGGFDSKPSDMVMVPESQNALSAMIQEHASNRDILLIAEAGQGFKTRLCQHFASLLGYKIHLFPMYKEMTALDLLMRRASNDEWVESPLLQAARNGQVCVLDGIDHLSPDTLSSLQALLCDREIQLPDGTRLSRDKDIQSSFRVIALASTQDKSRRPKWLSEEATSMFSTIVLANLSHSSLRQILQQHQRGKRAPLDQILKVQKKLQKSDQYSALSLRSLIRLVKHKNVSLRADLRNLVLVDLMSTNQREGLERILDRSGVEDTKSEEESTMTIQVDGDQVLMGDLVVDRLQASKPELVPNPFFFDIPSHVKVIRSLLSEWKAGERSFLLLGNQGTGKNKICDRVCELLNSEREYIQLHRDSTISQLTLTPSLEDGKIVWNDSPLVRAVVNGRALVIDEADKAPLEVVAVLKSLVEDRELLLADGRRICQDSDNSENGKYLFGYDCRNSHRQADNCICIHPNFTAWVLANRPGRLFHGNDFSKEIGDCFSAHVVPNPDLESEVRLLQSYAPTVEEALLRQITSAFDNLRTMFDSGDITYPYSTREAVAVARHLEQYPKDDLVSVLHNVLDLDSFDKDAYSVIGAVFRKRGFPFQNYKKWQEAIEASHRTGSLRVEFLDERSVEGKSHSPPPLSSPKIGKWDDKNEAHVGGNQWQGGTGGSDTAGLGGRGGPYRLDRGHKVHQVSDEAKAQMSKEAKEAARRIANKAFDDRLKEIKMSKEDFAMYDQFVLPIKGDIANLRATMENFEHKSTERGWLKNQVHGELDEARIVDGVAGEKNIYKRRGTTEPFGGSQTQRKKKLRFVVDCSGSMYRFNGYDQRLNRCLQAAALVMESLDGMDKFDYSIVGHSGDSRCIELVPFGKPTKDPRERLEILQTMVAHSQFCDSGDNTLGAIKQAVSDIDRVNDGSADEDESTSIVIAISDANLERYGIHPRELRRALESSSNTKAFCVFIASFGDEAEDIRRELPVGRGFVCMDSSELPAIVRNILTQEIG